MTKAENLFVTLMEECAEIQQATSKALRFGINNHHPATPQQTNEKDILTEYHQLAAVMEMLVEEGILTQLNAEEIEEIKTAKKFSVKRHRVISYEAGCLKEM